ncbi:MAG TPA: hypothetical protein VGL39_00290 [Jatrophihabitantaceae bacterium]|jgi:hypothetical protein
MRHRAILLAVAALTLSGATAIQSAQAKPPADPLDMYTVRAPAADAAGFAGSGLDVVKLTPDGATTEAQIVLSSAERDSLQARGYDVEVTRDAQGRSESQRAAAQAVNGFTVYRSWDEPSDTLYLGFGLEGITGPSTRNAVLGKAMHYLLR